MKIRSIVIAIIFLEVFPSWLLWIASPTDSVRVWYPSWLSYVAEHALASCLVAATLLLIFRVAGMSLAKFGYGRPPVHVSFTFKRTVLLVILLAAIDVAGTLIVWLVQVPGSGGGVMLWHTQRLLDYFRVRNSIHIVLATLIFGISLAKEHARRRAHLHAPGG